MDSLLEPYMTASSENIEQRLEQLLVEEVEPLVHKVIVRKLGAQCPDVEDVCGDVIVEATARLRQWKSDAGNCRVESFANYIAAIAFNSASEYLRRKSPRWRRLRDRIHYLLRHEPRLAIWESPHGGWLCGLAPWKGDDSSVPVPPASQCDQARGKAPQDSLRAVFQVAGGPLELDAMVELAAQLWGEALDRPDEPVLTNRLRALVPNADDVIDQRRYAERAWVEIVELPLRQRQAMLLNMKADGVDVFLLLAIASFRSLASALEMEPEELASLWNRLPLDDNTIAARMGLSRQQVINLRKSARKRLANRLEGWS